MPGDDSPLKQLKDELVEDAELIFPELFRRIFLVSSVLNLSFMARCSVDPFKAFKNQEIKIAVHVFEAYDLALSSQTLRHFDQYDWSLA